MALTEKGINALNHIKTHFPTGSFSASDLTAACGEKIVAATLNAVANNGYLNKLGGSPVQFEAVADFIELMENIESPKSKGGCDNTNLTAAKREQNDEFYTRYEDIEAEVMKYRKQFLGKVVYLPCDDPADKKSEFWSFFVNNFDAFGLKKLIATHYDENGKAYKIWIDGDTSSDGYIDDSDALQEDLIGNGDFRSPECVDILNECDIVCTNPPFSLFKDFLPWICNAGKNFLIIGPLNAVTYKSVFPYIRAGKIWSGYNNVRRFRQPDGSEKTMNNTFWYTNMLNKCLTDELVLTKTLDTYHYPKCDYHDAIYVDRVDNIPDDYSGCMAVPVSLFQGKFNPNQFEIIGCSYKYGEPIGYHYEGMPYGFSINGKEEYKKLFIKRKMRNNN